MPVPAAWGTCCSSHRPKPPPAVPPTGSPDSWTRLYPGTPAMPRSSRACTRTLLSLPFLGHSVIRFLNLEAALAPTGDPCPHWLWPTGPGPVVRPRPGWGILFLGAPCLRPAESDTTPPDFITVRPHRATQSAATLPATPWARVMGPFFLPLNHELGTKPQGGEIWDKERKKINQRQSELKGSVPRGKATSSGP